MNARGCLPNQPSQDKQVLLGKREAKEHGQLDGDFTKEFCQTASSKKGGH